MRSNRKEMKNYQKKSQQLHIEKKNDHRKHTKNIFHYTFNFLFYYIEF